MGVEAVLYFLAAVGNLFMAILVVLRARRALGALPIALLCLALFLWDMGECMQLMSSGEERWKYLALVGSSMAPAFLMHFAIVFCRREQSLWRWQVVLYAMTGAFALSTAGALTSSRLQDWVAGRVWNVAYLFALFPFLLWAFILVYRRRCEAQTHAERNALNFVSAGILIGAFTGFADLLRVFHQQIFLGHVGSLACSIVLAIAIFRHRMLEADTPVRRAMLILAVAASAVALNMWLFLGVQPKGGPALLGIAVVTVAAFALYRLLLLNWYEAAERRRRLALVGTMAAGVAHEIKNPLASIKGAAQLVQRDLDGRTDVEGARDYLKLVVGEVDRLNGVIEDFLAFARPREPRLADVSLNEVVEAVLKLQETTLPPGVTIERRLDPSLPVVSADAELLKQALINVLKNAIEAVGESGTVTVRTRSVSEAMRWWEVVEVEDTGPGVPLDDIERIFQPFHTTKTRGTGLGLAIAARVLEAHRGVISVENVQPRGARFRFHIPRRRL